MVLFLELFQSVTTWNRVIDVPSRLILTYLRQCIKRKGSPYSITERRVPELIPVLGS